MTSEDTAPRRAVVYARISKDRTGAGVGVGKQEADCRALAARLYPPVEIIDVYTDNDLTAFKGGSRGKPRPGYAALMEDIRSRRAEVVLAWHTDRLHRDMTELEGYITACGEGSDGIPTYTAKGGELHLDTASGRMVARILGAVAKQEVEHMIERQKSAKERGRKAGAWHGGPRPFGYQPDGPSIKNGGDGRLAQVPEEAAAIRKAYSTLLQLDPQQGLGAIAREWNAAGLLTPQKASRGGGNEWERTTVRTVLLRARNAGLIEYDGTVIGEGNWEPIVSPDTWRAAKAILTDPGRKQSPGPEPQWLLTGVLICGVCGGRKFRVASYGKRWQASPAYQCASMQYTPPAQSNSMKRWHLNREAGRLDEYVEQIIIERLRRPDVMAALNTRPEVDIPALDARRTAINAELDEWARTPGITPRQLAITNTPLLAELAGVERQISEALRSDPLPEFAGKDPAEVWAGLHIGRRRAIAAMLLRVRVLPVGKIGNPPGWRVGMTGRKPFRYDAVEILPADA
jgi:site-specific DNA recombinase